MSARARLRRGRAARASRPRRGSSARTPMSSRRAGLDCGTRADESAGRALPAARASYPTPALRPLRMPGRNSGPAPATAGNRLALRGSRPRSRPAELPSSRAGRRTPWRSRRSTGPPSTPAHRRRCASRLCSCSRVLRRANGGLEAQPTRVPATTAAVSLRLTISSDLCTANRRSAGRSAFVPLHMVSRRGVAAAGDPNRRLRACDPARGKSRMPSQNSSAPGLHRSSVRSALRSASSVAAKARPGFTWDVRKNHRVFVLLDLAAGMAIDVLGEGPSGTRVSRTSAFEGVRVEGYMISFAVGACRAAGRIGRCCCASSCFPLKNNGLHGWGNCALHTDQEHEELPAAPSRSQERARPIAASAALLCRIRYRIRQSTARQEHSEERLLRWRTHRKQRPRQ